MQIEYSTTAACPPEEVWAVLSQVERWNEWSSFISGAKWTEGQPWQHGSQLQLDIPQPKFTIRTTVSTPMPPSQVTLNGKMMGVSFEHYFEFSPQPGGGTLIKSRITLSGPATFFINDSMKKQGLGYFSQWLDALKGEAEKRTQ